MAVLLRRSHEDSDVPTERAVLVGERAALLAFVQELTALDPACQSDDPQHSYYVLDVPDLATQPDLTAEQVYRGLMAIQTPSP
jgi:hypothetical protein